MERSGDNVEEQRRRPEGHIENM